MISSVIGRILRQSPARRNSLALSASLWLAMAQAASAQGPNAAAPPKDYYLQYMLVSFCIALGLLAALRPSPRKDPEGGDAGWFGMMKGGGHAESGPSRPGERKKLPHRGNLLLILSILGIPFCIPSIIAANMAKQDLAAMKAARMDKNGEGLTNVSFWISIAAMGLWVLSVLIGVLVTLLG